MRETAEPTKEASEEDKYGMFSALLFKYLPLTN